LKRVFVYLHSTETYESLAKMLQQMRWWFFETQKIVWPFVASW
jgi:hypothetical protein